MNKENIYIINLNKDIQRKEYCLKEFEKYFNINFIEGVIDKNPKKGCFLSHLKCIQYAKENNMDYIIVLEDDCIIKGDKTDFLNKFNIITEYLLNNINDWNLFLGGTNNVKTRDIKNKFKYNKLNLFKIDKGNTFHFVIYNKNCYDYFLNYQFNIQPIDKIWHKKLIAIVIVPFLCIQKPYYSNIQKEYVDLIEVFQKQENHLLRRLPE